ncbi:hypothetical protein QBC37DRAFT_487340 [Rhypophila decipiens]|uniref:Yeast cell wall synthesis Kre9/Knh1-like N-terminal domain-containing protein n=1 Tax=Rhypophila decipiens TaxID=261697 RepID=A0AAN7B1P9_9PEZI|nr:hypothetical protein QBC37DRAFT_487340 [Rhypophila decipiens]
MMAVSSPRWTLWLITLLVLVTRVVALSPKTPKITNEQYHITVDVPFTITWSDVIGPGVTIDLLELTGDKTIMFKESITNGVHRDGHHVWIPPPWLSATETYLLGIIDEATNEVGYSSTFMVVGGVLPDLKVRGTNITERQGDNDTNTVIPPEPTTEVEPPPESTPFVILPDTSTGTESGTTSFTTSTTSGTASAAPTESSHPNSTNVLSTGAKAGIGVGAAAGVLVLIAGLVYFIRRRRVASGVAEPAGGIYESTGHANEPRNVQMFPTDLTAGGREDVPRVQRVGFSG